MTLDTDSPPGAGKAVRKDQPAAHEHTLVIHMFAYLMLCPWGVSLGCGAKEGTEFSKLSQHQIDRSSRR